MELTREQAIAEHRKMYNAMADEIEKKKRRISVFEWKTDYLYKIGFYGLDNDCFLCQYTTEKFPKEKCQFVCPLIWGNKTGDSCMTNEGKQKGLFTRLLFAKTWKEQAALARQIANLPEREDV